MFVSIEPEAKYSPNGWKSRLVMLALCPESERRTERNRTTQLFYTTENKYRPNTIEGFRALYWLRQGKAFIEHTEWRLNVLHIKTLSYNKMK